LLLPPPALIPNGPPGSSDSLLILDGSVAAGGNGVVWLVYKGRSNARRPGAIHAARSPDGGLTFVKSAKNPLKYAAGPNDLVQDRGTFHLFYGDRGWDGKRFREPPTIRTVAAPDPENFDFSAARRVLTVGAPGSMDSRCVNGAKIFRVTGDPRWFMLYECSAHFTDYPERFHCAVSPDLAVWRKVTNPAPLFTRGEPGQWDQGAVWTVAVIEHDGRLYEYYEGWGSFQNDAAKRDTEYYPGGNSRVGLASVSVADFLAWVDAQPPLPEDLTPHP
jgi:hypothetical protein